MSLTFYYAPMSSSTRVHLALEELGIPYEGVRVDLQKGENRTPEFLALNPNGKVPLLVVDGTPIFESLAQILYLGETYGVEKGLFPAAGLARAEALKWLCWGSVSVSETFARIIKSGERVPAEQQNPAARAAAAADARSLLLILNKHMQGRKFVLGDEYSLVDPAMAGLPLFGARLGIDMTGLDALTAWGGRVASRPAFARVMSPSA